MTVGTVFHRTHLPLQKWFLALVLLRDNKAISVRRLASALRVNKNTSARLIAQIDRARTQAEERQRLAQIVRDITRR